MEVFDMRRDSSGAVGSFVMQLSVQQRGGRLGTCEPFVNLLHPARAEGGRVSFRRRQLWVRDPAWSKTSTLQVAWKDFSLTKLSQVSTFLRIAGSERGCTYAPAGVVL